MSERSDQHARAFRIHGMHCAEEVSALKRELGPLVGGADNLAFDMLGGKLTLAANVGTASQQIIDAVARAGMRAVPWNDAESDAQAREAATWSPRTILTAISGVGTLAGLPVSCVAGRRCGRRAFRGRIRHRSCRSDSGAGALWPSHTGRCVAGAPQSRERRSPPAAGHESFDDDRRHRRRGHRRVAGSGDGGVPVLVVAAPGIVERGPRAASDRRITRIWPPPRRVVRGDDGSETSLSPQEVPIGATLIVKPGERFPLDGRVIAGVSHVNQAPVTGESRPVEKGAGDEVFAGTINGDGALTVETTKDAGHTTLANIIRMVGEAHSRRAPSEQWVEKFARVYTPLVMLLALAVLLVPPLLFRSNLGRLDL